MKKVVRKNKKKRNRALKVTNREVLTGIDHPFLPPTIRAANEVSSSLAFGITDGPLLSSYNNLIDSQDSILSYVNNLSNKLSLTSGEVGIASSNIIAPLSSAIANVGTLAASANQDYALGAISNDLLNSAQSIAGTAIEAIETQQEMIQGGIVGVTDKEDLNKLTLDTVPALNLVSAGINHLTHSLPAFPDPTKLPTSIKEINQTITGKTNETYQDKLDDILKVISKDLVDYRKGCWETFNRKGEDYIGQASSSMRRLVDNLLRLIAPNDQVQKTEYFQNSSKAKDEKGRPTRKAKIFYILGYDKNKTYKFKRLADSLLNMHENLSGWDHNPKKEDSFVEGVFITIEGCLLSLMSVWRKGS